MPQNCSADVAAVIAYVDDVFSGDNTTAIDALKDVFGLSEISHLDDVAGSCEHVDHRNKSFSLTCFV